MRSIRATVALVIVLAGVAAAGATVAQAVVAAPSPGVVAGGFCTYGTGYFKTNSQAAQLINENFNDGVNPIAAIGDTNFYQWLPTGINVQFGKARRR